MRRFNERLATRATLAFGSMAAFYLFVVYPLAALLFPKSVQNLVFFISSGWIQLWALPLIAVGSNILGRAAERRAIETHDAVMAELADLRTLAVALHVKIEEATAA